MKKLNDPNYHEECLSGEKLFGDGLDSDELDKWFRSEEKGYYSIEKAKSKAYDYPYHALDYEYAFRHLDGLYFKSVLGIGSAYGEEFKPIAQRCRKFTILEPTLEFASEQIYGTPAEYVVPKSTGHFPFEDESFDLVTCFSVLHHIPNVPRILSEMNRCLIEGGLALIREPVISMGDWRHSRPGLTRFERGIPLRIFEQMIFSADLQILKKSRCVYSLTSRARYLTKKSAFNSKLFVGLDKLLCRYLSLSDSYHPKRSFEKLKATSVFFILKKRSRS
jgi:SAM-dependent methyltransferase